MKFLPPAQGPTPQGGSNEGETHDQFRRRLGITAEPLTPENAPRRYDLTKISVGADNRIADFEQSCWRWRRGESEAIAHFYECRKALYQYVASLEEQLGIKRTETRTFE